MHCCFLTLNLLGGGAERQLLQLVRYWPRDDSQLRVVLLEGQGVWLDEVLTKVPVYALSEQMPSGRVSQILWALRLVPRLRQFFLHHPCDIVLTFLWLPTLVAGLAFSRLNPRPKVVWSVQSDLAQSFQLHWDGWLRNWLVRTFLSRQVDHFVAISQGIKLKTQQLLKIVDDERITVIPNSVDLACIYQMTAKQDSPLSKRASIRLMSVARLHEAKGVEALLQALSQVREQNDDWECMILGDGPKRQGLVQMANELGLDSYVHFAGYVPNPYAWLQTADIFVSPSRWEAFGIALVEAMALGLPIIATETDGTKDIIDPYVDGVVVPVGDAGALSQAILELASSPERRVALGQKAREKSKRYDAPIVAARYASVLNQVLTREQDDSN